MNGNNENISKILWELTTHILTQSDVKCKLKGALALQLL